MALPAWAFVLPAIALGACRSLPPSVSDGCTAPRNGGAPAPDSVVWPRLVGDFAVVQVDTNGRHAAVSQRMRLRLAWNDSVHRWTREGLWIRRPMPPTNRPIAGTIGSRGWMDSAIVEGRVISIGCRTCTDASPNRLTVVQADRGGFRGWWVNPGNGLLRSGIGEPERMAAGYFCARRLSAR